MKRSSLGLMIPLLAAASPAWAGCTIDGNCPILSATFDSRQAWIDKVDEARRRSATYVARAYAAYVASRPAIELPKTVERSEATNYLNDPTLRRNDIIVTEEGFLVYKGRAGSQRSYSDFVYLSEVDAQRTFLSAAKSYRLDADATAKISRPWRSARTTLAGLTPLR